LAFGFFQRVKPTFNPTTMLRLVSRTFALSIEQLPSLLRDAITLAYLMFRVSDFLEDNEAMTPARKAELLQLWAGILGGDDGPEALEAHLADVDPNDPEAFVAQQAGEVMARLRKLPPELQQMICDEASDSAEGMARWQTRGSVVLTEDDMDDYMFEVAGRVGHMVIKVFGWYAQPIRELQEQLMPLAREFGLALQTVNVIRGLREDYERGWIYVPESFCAEVGLRPPDLFMPENIEKAIIVVDALADKAERHLGNGLALIKLLPRRYHRLRLACIWPLLFAARTLALTRQNLHQVLESEAKITRDEIKEIIVDTTRWGWSNRWLEDYYERLIAR
jgi:farnesyl-diphosphate farnesyltransferase